jgi:hypothetical protein
MKTNDDRDLMERVRGYSSCFSFLPLLLKRKGRGDNSTEHGTSLNSLKPKEGEEEV